MWEQVIDDYSVIGRSLFKKETNIQLFVGLKVHLSTGELGVIDSSFGQSGKFKINIPGEYGYFLLLSGVGRPWRNSSDHALTVPGPAVRPCGAQSTMASGPTFVAGKPVWVLEEPGVELASGLSRGQGLNMSSHFTVTIGVTLDMSLMRSAHTHFPDILLCTRHRGVVMGGDRCEHTE